MFGFIIVSISNFVEYIFHCLHNLHYIIYSYSSDFRSSGCVMMHMEDSCKEMVVMHLHTLFFEHHYTKYNS